MLAWACFSFMLHVVHLKRSQALVTGVYFPQGTQSPFNKDFTVSFRSSNSTTMTTTFLFSGFPSITLKGRAIKLQEMKEKLEIGLTDICRQQSSELKIKLDNESLSSSQDFFFFK